MSFSPEQPKKIIIVITTLLLLAGAAFLIFAIFFNKATLLINLSPNYEVNIVNLRSQTCLESPCVIILAPGTYQIQINKSGFLPSSAEYQLSLGQILTVNPILDLEPTIKPLGNWDASTIPILDNDLPIFTISTNTPTKIPALFNQNQPSLPLLYFLRNISKYRLFSSRDGQLVALLDESNSTETSLYLLDLTTKTRTLLTSGNLLDFEWLESRSTNRSPSSFLLLRRNPVSLEEEIYLGKLNGSTRLDLETLPFRSELKAVYPLSEEEIIYVSTFSTDTPIGFSIQKLNLKTRENQTIFAVDDLPLPTRLEYDSATATVYLESEQTAYSINPLNLK